MNKVQSVVQLSALMVLALTSCTREVPAREDEIATAIAETQQMADIIALIETATQEALEPPATETSPPPTDTPRATPTVKWPVVAIENVEEALSEAGYKRYPFTTEDGYAAFTWVKESNYLRVTTFEDGTIEIEVLHDPSQNVRAKAIEKKFEVLDRVFQPGFMTQLRRENDQYNSSISGRVSGEPDDVITYDDGWNTVWAEYNAEETVIGGYSVRFSVWFWQSTCPPEYYCWYDDFPGLEFEGDSSFTFYTILLYPRVDGDILNQNL